MWGLLAVIGLGVILWWVSKGLKRLSIWLGNTGMVVADLMTHVKCSDRVARQNIIAEEKLQTIKGEGSNVTFMHNARKEIDTLCEEVSRGEE